MIELDDSDVISTAVLVVTFKDHVERWGPAPLPLAIRTFESLSLHPPKDYVTAVVEDDDAPQDAVKP